MIMWAVLFICNSLPVSHESLRTWVPRLEITKIIECDGQSMEITKIIECDGQSTEITKIIECDGQSTEITKIIECEARKIECTTIYCFLLTKKPVDKSVRNCH